MVHTACDASDVVMADELCSEAVANVEDGIHTIVTITINNSNDVDEIEDEKEYFFIMVAILFRWFADF